MDTLPGREQWYIVTPFGYYEIPGTKLHGTSDGIDIAVPTGTTVKSVADGEALQWLT